MSTINPLSKGQRRACLASTLLIASSVFTIVVSLILATLVSYVHSQRPVPVRRPDASAAYNLGQTAAPLIDLLIVAGPAMVVAPVVFLGGVMARRTRSYWLAVVGSVFSMLPCTVACIFGIPIGVWALVLLLDPEVRASFRNAG